MSKKRNPPSIYNQGYKAYQEGVTPDRCPYLYVIGRYYSLEDAKDVSEWLSGWSDALKDQFGD